MLLINLRSTSDDVDVLKRELITVQQRMNDMSLEKEQQMEKFRLILTEKFVKCFKLNITYSYFIVMNLYKNLINSKIYLIK